MSSAWTKTYRVEKRSQGGTGESQIENEISEKYNLLLLIVAIVVVVLVLVENVTSVESFIN